MLFVFVRGAEADVSDDNSDKVFTWMCPRDKIDCEDRSDLNAEGWAVYAILMTIHLLKDVINGSKMVMLATREGHSLNARIRYFLGGLVLCSVTLFTLFVSTIYNQAIATSNTELIINA